MLINIVRFLGFKEVLLWLIGDNNMEKNNGKEKRARELFAKEVQE